MMLRATMIALGVAALLAGTGATAAEAAKAVSPTTSPGGSTANVGFPTTGWRTNFRKHSVPLSEITSGGPGKDGIPALDHPGFLPVAKTTFLRPQEPVISLVVRGDARAYPLQILIWHEIVNDRVGGIPVTVTFCPLCNTSIVFDRRLRGRVLDFGTSGNLRNSDLVMYDRQTESWWQQFGGKAIVGDLTGATLRQLPAQILSWREFQRQHPAGKVLSRDTGFARSYGSNPYTGYDDVKTPPFFPAANTNDKRLQPKERVVFIERGKDAVVVPFSVLAKRNPIRVTVGGHKLVVSYRKGVSSALDSANISAGRDTGSAQVFENGKLVPFDEPFWFSVAAFRPHVTIVKA